MRSLPAMLAIMSLVVAGDRARAQDPYADAPPYLKPAVSATRLQPIVTVGQQIPLTGDPAGRTFRVVGIPDGLGLGHRDGSLRLLVNHEFRQGQGGPAGPLPAGARVSEFDLDPHKGGAKVSARALSGRYPIRRVFEYNGSGWTDVSGSGRQIARLCSAFLAGEGVGFDRPIFLHGEENAPPATFDAGGGQAWADVDDATFNLPFVGRAEWENIVAAPFTGTNTVLFALEDGPSSRDGQNSQVYMFVGEKQRGSADPLARNGLGSGRVYVFAGDDPAHNSEASFTGKGTSVSGHWAEVDWKTNPTAASFDAASRVAGSFLFVRVEDGAADPRQPGVFYFVTTGSPGTANPFGRLYQLDFDPANPVGAASLTLLLDGSEGIVSPDNIDVNKHGEIAILEDPNYNLASLGLTRDSSVFIYRPASKELTRVAEIDRPAARAHALAADPANTSVPSSDVPGGWESSGVVDAERFLGRGTWILDVQAHSLRIAPVSETVEGGQILLMVWKPEDEGGRD